MVDRRGAATNRRNATAGSWNSAAEVDDLQQRLGRQRREAREILLRGVGVPPRDLGGVGQLRRPSGVAEVERAVDHRHR